MSKRNVHINRIVEVESSAIDRLLYSTRDQVLVVEFHNGNRAAYGNVGTITFATLVVAESVGKTYNEKIKHNTLIKHWALDDLRLGIFEEPETPVEEQFPIGTAVRVNKKGATITHPSVKEGAIGLVSEHEDVSSLTVTFVDKNINKGKPFPQYLNFNEVDKV